MDTKPTLVYFDIRGRAEPIRMMLSFLGVEFTETQITQAQWEAAPLATPFGRMPVYREGPLEIPETFAIMNYLGRKHNLCGTREVDRVRSDVTAEAWRDYGNRIANLFGAKSTSDEARKNFLIEEQPSLLADLETYYLQNEPRSGYWAGASITVGDFAAFHMIEGLAQSSNTLANFPALLAFYEFFAAQPAIKAYLQSPQRPAALFHGPDGKIYPQD